MKIIVLDAFTMGEDVSWDSFRALGKLEKYDRTHPEQIQERAHDAEVLLVNKVRLGESELAQLPRLKYIGVLATGYDVIDLNAVRASHIAVTKIPEYGTDSVAQITWGHILNLCNQLGLHISSVDNGNWTHSEDFCYRLTRQTGLYGKTLGLVGYGRIARAVAAIGRSFGMKVMVFTPHPDLSAPETQYTTLDELFAQSDVVSLHCPATPENREFVARPLLARMKPGAFIVNTARGSLIHEQSLADALNSGRIAGAGLDVLSQEPPPEANPLLHAKNCFITPHLGWGSSEARQKLLKTAAENLKAFLEHRKLNRVD